MIYYSISLFCTTFPIVFVLVLFILTWKWLYGANLVSSPSAYFASKRPRRSRHHRGTTEVKANASWNSDISYAADDDALPVPVSNGLHASYCITVYLPPPPYPHLAV